MKNEKGKRKKAVRAQGMQNAECRMQNADREVCQKSPGRRGVTGVSEGVG
jgi:hypothetical protein